MTIPAENQSSPYRIIHPQDAYFCTHAPHEEAIDSSDGSESSLVPEKRVRPKKIVGKLPGLLGYAYQGYARTRTDVTKEKTEPGYECHALLLGKIFR